MSCAHTPFVEYDQNTEEWYCRRCGDVTEQPNWSEEEITEAKGEA